MEDYCMVVEMPGGFFWVVRCFPLNTESLVHDLSTRAIADEVCEAINRVARNQPAAEA